MVEIKQQILKNGEVSLTDKDARLMSANNMQTAVDEKNHIIIAADVINNPADQGQLKHNKYLMWIK